MNPTSTIEQYNNITMFWKNGTQSFMDLHFTPADHKHVQQKAQEEDASGITAARQAAHVTHMDATATENTEKAQTKKIRDTATAARIAAIVIITDRTLIQSKKFTNPKLDEQLEAHRQRDTMVPIKARLTVKEKKVEALDRYEGTNADDEMLDA